VKPSGTRARRISRSPRPPTGDSVEKDRHRTRARASAPSDQAPVTLCAPERSLRWCTRSIYGRRRRGFHEPCRPRRSLPPSTKSATLRETCHRRGISGRANQKTPAFRCSQRT